MGKDDEDGEKRPATRRRERKNESQVQVDDEDFVVSEVIEELSDEDMADENMSQEAEEPETRVAEVEPDTNEIQRRRCALLQLWKEFIELPGQVLRKIPDELRQTWNSQKKKKKKRFVCAENECGKSFTTIPGIVYHMQRCGIANLETAKCKLCDETAHPAKRLLPHLFTAHLDQLPRPPDELTVGLKDYKKQKSSSSSIAIKRNYAYKDLYDETLKYRKSNERSNLFSNRMPIESEWKPLSATQAESYLPQAQQSANFRIEGQMEWESMKRFESLKHGPHRTFFTGGPVFSAAWVPTPSSKDTQDQYLALCVGVNFEDSHPLSDQDAEPCLIQVWNFGKLQLNVRDTDEARLSFGIAQTDGIVWSMEWCPFGNGWMAPNSRVESGYFPRLGLLCLGCGNGVVKILSIPHPKYLTSASRTTACPIFMPSPVLILDPPGVGPLTNYEPSICKSISWSRTNEQKFIAAGYGSGIIAVWNITTESRFLKSAESTNKCTILLPVFSFVAHGTSVNAVSWCPYEGSMVLASGSGLDRDLAFWDLTDLSSARRTGGKRGFLTSMEWPFRWPGVFVSQDAAFNKLRATVVFVSMSSNTHPTITTSIHRSTVWSVSYNEWNNAQASGDASGEVVLYRGFSDRNRHSRSHFQNRLPIFRVAAKPLSDVGQKERPEVYYSYEAFVKEWGLELHDSDLKSEKKIAAADLDRLKSEETMRWEHPSNYPLLSVNRVSWNPNRDSHTWLFAGSQSGVCRLSCVFLSQS